MTNKEKLLPIIPIGISEIAQIINVDRKKVAQYKFHKRLPEPDYILEQGPLWDLNTFNDWYETIGIIDKRYKENK